MREKNESLNNGQATEKRLRKRIAVITALALCLLITTIALAYSAADVKDNYYQTGIVKINLNDGKPVVSSDSVSNNGKAVDISRIEPGMTLKAPFFIENESTISVYYKLYFKEVSGALSDVLEIEIREKTDDGSKGNLICSGTAKELANKNVMPEAKDTLKEGERKDLIMYIHFPEEEGNEAQEKTLEFSMAADAVQTKNNPDKEF